MNSMFLYDLTMLVVGQYLITSVVFLRKRLFHKHYRSISQAVSHRPPARVSWDNMPPTVRGRYMHADPSVSLNSLTCGPLCRSLQYSAAC